MVENNIKEQLDKEMGDKYNWLNITCFLWGDWPRGIEYVHKLYRGCVRNLSLPFEFFCFTDKDPSLFEEGVNVIPLPEEVLELPLNLKKIYVFKKHDFFVSNRVIVIDLDSVIVGSLDDMFSYSGPWCSVKPFLPQNVNRWTGGGLISFEADRFYSLWDTLISDVPLWFDKTEGGWEKLFFYYTIQPMYHDRWQDLYLGQFVGYKRHIRRFNNKLKKNTRFVCFHRRPQPHEVEDINWMKEHWR